MYFSKRGRTTLHVAAEENNLALAKALVRAGADIQKRDEFLRTPLYCAVLHSSKPVEEYLRTIQVRSRTIFEAAENDCVATLIQLMKPGVSADKPDKFGRTALHIAAHFNSWRAIIFLLERGADHSARDNRGKTPLHKAASSQSLKAAKLLIKYGAPVDIPDNRGNTPLHIAFMKDFVCLEHLLIENGAKK